HTPFCDDVHFSFDCIAILPANNLHADFLNVIVGGKLASDRIFITVGRRSLAVKTECDGVEDHRLARPGFSADQKHLTVRMLKIDCFTFKCPEVFHMHFNWSHDCYLQNAVQTIPFQLPSVSSCRFPLSSMHIFQSHLFPSYLSSSY